MRHKLVCTVAAVVALFAVTSAADAKSSIFGSAQVTPLSKTQASSVTGKGSASNLYGYYGLYYLSLSTQYASLAQYYNYIHYNYSAGSNYLTARSYALTAASYFYYAYYYRYGSY